MKGIEIERASEERANMMRKKFNWPETMPIYSIWFKDKNGEFTGFHAAGHIKLQDVVLKVSEIYSGMG